MPNLRWQELLIIVALVVLLFGAKRLPDAARGVGRSLRIFKAETKGLVDEADGNGSTDDARSSDQAADEAGHTSAPSSSPSALESGESSNRINVEAPAATDPVEPADRPRSNG